MAYKTLFSIDIIHSYFLNSGEETYENLSSGEREKLLSRYRWQEFLEIIPTPKTEKMMRKQQMLIKNTASLLRVVVRTMDDGQQPFIPIDPELIFCFSVSYKDPYFENFTEMEFLSSRKMLFTNVVPAPLPGLGFHPISLAAQEVFYDEQYTVSQEDFALLQRAEGTTFPSTVKGLIYLRMHGENGSLNIINVNGTLKINPTIFSISFSNRKTFWRYIHKGNEGFQLETTAEKPLTKSGFIEIDPNVDFESAPSSIQDFDFPNPDYKAIKHQNDKYYSEIYI